MRKVITLALLLVALAAMAGTAAASIGGIVEPWSNARTLQHGGIGSP